MENVLALQMLEPIGTDPIGIGCLSCVSCTAGVSCASQASCASFLSVAVSLPVSGTRG